MPAVVVDQLCGKPVKPVTVGSIDFASHKPAAPPTEHGRCHRGVTTWCEFGGLTGTAWDGLRWSGCFESHCGTAEFSQYPAGAQVGFPLIRLLRTAMIYLDGPSLGLKLCSTVVRWLSRPRRYAVGSRPSLDSYCTTAQTGL